MITPIDTLYSKAKNLKDGGHKTISIEFVLSMIDRQRTLYDTDVLKAHGETEDVV